MASKKGKYFGILPKELLIPISIIGVLIAVVLINSDFLMNLPGAQVTTPDEPGTNYFEVDATIKFQVSNLLNGTGLNDAGSTLVIYDPNDAGVALDTIQCGQGSATSAILFHTGRVLGVKFNGVNYLDYSWEITVPAATSPKLTAVTYPTVLKVLNFPTVAKGTDFSVEKDGTAIYDGDGTPSGLDAIKPDTDIDPEISIKFKNSGEGNTGYGHPTVWTDYATTTPGLEQRGSWFVIEFALNVSNTVMSNVNDYLRFEDLGGFSKTAWGTSVILYKQMDSEYLCGFNDDDDSGSTQNGLTGNGFIGGFQLDFDGAISQTAWTEEIIIKMNFQASYGIQYMLDNEVIAQAGDKPYGVDGGQYLITSGDNYNYRLSMG